MAWIKVRKFRTRTMPGTHDPAAMISSSEINGSNDLKEGGENRHPNNTGNPRSRVIAKATNLSPTTVSGLMSRTGSNENKGLDQGGRNGHLDNADALETYLRGKDMQSPMLGAQRRIEGRIGQLLGPAPGEGRKEMGQHADRFHKQFRKEFRLLAPALAGKCELT